MHTLLRTLPVSDYCSKYRWSNECVSPGIHTKMFPNSVLSLKQTGRSLKSLSNQT